MSSTHSSPSDPSAPSPAIQLEAVTASQMEEETATGASSTESQEEPRDVAMPRSKTRHSFNPL